MEILRSIILLVSAFFALYLIVYATFLFCSVIVGAIKMSQRRVLHTYKNEYENKSFIPISIIVPAYNEEVTIIETINSLLTLEYNYYEIIVVDDGSKDETSKVVKDYFKMTKAARPIQYKIDCQPVENVYECHSQKVPLTLIRKKNGGKADALNMGINAAFYGYFICMDADSVLQHDALQKIAVPFLEDENCVASGGAIMLCNGVELDNGRVKKYDLPKNIIACMQAVEYTRSFLASRLLFDEFNGNLIISGAFGMFKKDVVIAVNGYDHSTKGEDMELVVKLHEFCHVNNRKYSIKYAPDAICWTQAPEKLRDLCTQRRRWHVGLFQCMLKYRNMFFDFNRPAVAFSYLYFLFYELLSPFIEILGIFVTIAIVALQMLNVEYCVAFYLVYVIFGTILSITSYFTTIYMQNLTFRFKNIFKIILLTFFETAALHFIMLWTRATAFRGYKKNKRNWGSIERKKINSK